MALKVSAEEGIDKLKFIFDSYSFLAILVLLTEERTQFLKVMTISKVMTILVKRMHVLLTLKV